MSLTVGKIVFGPRIAFAPQGVIGAEARDLGLGVWKTLGLKVEIEPEIDQMPEPCFDENEMRRRNESARRAREGS